MQNPKVEFDRERLHSSITCSMRKRNIPMYVRGVDILRGVIFGRIDHPEYSIDDAIAKAVEMCSIPGRPETVEEGYQALMELLDVHKNELDEIIGKFEEDIFKDYYYSSVVKFLKMKGMKIGDLATEYLKNMIYKKLVADESTEDCMYRYAYQRSLFSDEILSLEETKRRIDSATKEICENNTAYEYAIKTAKEIKSSL